MDAISSFPLLEVARAAVAAHNDGLIISILQGLLKARTVHLDSTGHGMVMELQFSRDGAAVQAMPAPVTLSLDELVPYTTSKKTRSYPPMPSVDPPGLPGGVITKDHFVSKGLPLFLQRRGDDRDYSCSACNDDWNSFVDEGCDCTEYARAHVNSDAKYFDRDDAEIPFHATEGLCGTIFFNHISAAAESVELNRERSAMMHEHILSVKREHLETQREQDAFTE